MNKLKESRLQSLSANEFTQFIRGALFVHCDYLLTTLQLKKDCEKAELDVILAFCSTLLQLVCLWLTIYPELDRYVSAFLMA
jgi:hypothetical protein